MYILYTGAIITIRLETKPMFCRLDHTPRSRQIMGCEFNLDEVYPLVSFTQCEIKQSLSSLGRLGFRTRGSCSPLACCMQPLSQTREEEADNKGPKRHVRRRGANGGSSCFPLFLSSCFSSSSQRGGDKDDDRSSRSSRSERYQRKEDGDLRRRDNVVNSRAGCATSAASKKAHIVLISTSATSLPSLYDVHQQKRMPKPRSFPEIPLRYASFTTETDIHKHRDSSPARSYSTTCSAKDALVRVSVDEKIGSIGRVIGNPPHFREGVLSGMNALLGTATPVRPLFTFKTARNAQDDKLEFSCFRQQLPPKSLLSSQSTRRDDLSREILP